MKRNHRIIQVTAIVTVLGGIGISALHVASSPSGRGGSGKGTESSGRAVVSSRAKSSRCVDESLHLLKSVSEEQFSSALKGIVDDWETTELARDVEALFARPDGGVAIDELRAAMLRRWASIEPGDAAHWAMSLNDEALRSAAIDQVVLAWAAIDPDAAAEWVKALPDESGRQQASMTLAYELSGQQPSKAYDLALSWTGTPEGVHCMEHAIANWALEDPHGALSVVSELADDVLRNAALAALATSWAESDPVAAATLVVDVMETEAAQQQAVAAIIQRWAQQDPQQALSWVEAFPEGGMKQNAVSLIEEQIKAANDPE
jgi:hypothetical protein